MITKILGFIGFHRHRHLIFDGYSVTRWVCDDCGATRYEVNI